MHALLDVMFLMSVFFFFVLVTVISLVLSFNELRF